VWAGPVRGDGSQTATQLKSGLFVVPRVAVSAAGSAVAWWTEYVSDAPHFARIHRSVMSAAGAWSEPKTIGAPTEDEVTASMTMDDTGRILATWTAYDNAAGSDAVLADRFDNGVWSQPWRVDTPAPEVTLDGDAYAMMTGAGSAALLWTQTPVGEAPRSVFRILDPSGAAGPAASMPDPSSVPETPPLMDDAGNAMFVLSEYDAPSRRQLRARRYAQGRWERPESIETDNELTDDENGPWPFLAMNRAGSAFVVWRKKLHGALGMWTRGYMPELGWQTATCIDKRVGEYGAPSVAVSADGGAGAVWTFGSSVWASFFNPPKARRP
jgi:hypothetical protein